MALLRYMRPIGGLPDPRGSLSTTIPAQAIAKEIERWRRQLGQRLEANVVLYVKHSASQRSQIAKYACEYGAAAAARL